MLFLILDVRMINKSQKTKKSTKLARVWAEYYFVVVILLDEEGSAHMSHAMDLEAHGHMSHAMDLEAHGHMSHAMDLEAHGHMTLAEGLDPIHGSIRPQGHIRIGGGQLL